MIGTIEMTTIVCGECGIEYAVPEVWRRDRQEHGAVFWCPNGDSREYRVSEVKRLEQEKAALQSRFDQEQAARKSAECAAEVAQRRAARAKLRAEAGVC